MKTMFSAATATSVNSRTASVPWALPALVTGAIAIGASPIFVRLSELGPFATAFWRVALALPLLWAWHAAERRTPLPLPPRAHLRTLILAGVLFAGDLIFWHLAILNTTVANATLYANFSTVVVAVGAWLVLGERPGRRLWAGLALALAGAALLSGASLRIDPAYIVGDGYGVITAVFFGTYILTVRAGRARLTAAGLMLWSGLVTAGILLFVTLGAGETLWPETWRGWPVLVALAWVSHAAGQGMLALALGHLPAAFSALVVLLEPVAAAVLGWLVLNEAITPMQGIGGAVILAGVMLARERNRRTNGKQ